MCEDAELNLNISMHCTRPYINGKTLVMPVPTPHTIEHFEQEIHRLIGRAFPENKFISSVEVRDDRYEVARELMHDYRSDYTRHGDLHGRDNIRSTGYSRTISKFEGTGDEMIDGVITALNEGRNEWGSFNHLPSSTFASELDDKGFITLLNEATTMNDIERLLELIYETEQQDTTEDEDEQHRSASETGSETGEEEGTDPEGDQQEDEADGGDGGVDEDFSSEDDTGQGDPEGSEGHTGGDTEGDQVNGSNEETGSTPSEDDERGNTTPEADQGSDKAGDDTNGEEATGGEENESDGGTDGSDGGQLTSSNWPDVNDTKSSLEEIGLLDEGKPTGWVNMNDQLGEWNQEEGDKSPYVPQDRQATVTHLKDMDRRMIRQGNVTSITEIISKMSLSKKIKKHLLTMVQRSYSYGLRQGRINGKALHKVASQRNPKIFKKRGAPKLDQSTAISILVDFSYSMNGRRYHTAAAACISIGQVLASIGIPFEAVGYTTGTSGRNSYYVVKGFDERVVDEDEMISRFSSSVIDMDRNEDSSAIPWAIERLLRRREDHKTMIVLSDGLPNGYGIGDKIQALKDIVGDIEDKGVVDICGIGILTNKVELFYKNNYVLGDVDELEPALIQVIKERVIV